MPISIFNKEDIGYLENGFRFGFCEENGEFNKVLETIYNLYGKVNIGLHLHCNSITRSPEVYKAIGRYASYIIEKYNLEPSFIDIGGGYFGGLPDKPTPMDYINIVKKELIRSVDPEKTKLIIEPGSAIIGSAVDLITTVKDTKSNGYCRVITTDGSRIHIDPLWKKNSYTYSVETESINLSSDKQMICGYTCMDHDRIMILNNEKELKTGDKIIYHRVGAYTVTFGGMFINTYPDVYVKTDNGIKRIRRKITVEDYYDIHNNYNK